MPATDIGIDLGSRNSLVYSTTQGIMLSEPTVAVYDRSAGKIRAIGEEARQMTGRLNTNLEVVRPIRHGVVSDYIVLEKMLKYFISKALGRRAFRKPRIAVCVPAGITEIECRAIEEATYQSGARKVYLAKAPIAAAIGAGIDILKPFGNMIVDIGAGTTDVAVVTIGGMAVQNSVRIAGDSFSQAIMRYMREKHSLFIGEETAETVKLRIGTAFAESEVRVMDVKGRNVVTGLPKIVRLSSEEVRMAMREPAGQIVDTIHGVLEKTPPELAADIVHRGILLTGGGAQLSGLDRLIEDRIGVHTMTVHEPVTAAVVGTGKYAEVMTKFDSGRQ